MKFKVFYIKRWLTPATIKKVRDIRSSVKLSGEDIQYRREECKEVLDVEHEEDIQAWKQRQNVPLPDLEDVLQEYVDIFSVREVKE